MIRLCNEIFAPGLIDFISDVQPLTEEDLHGNVQVAKIETRKESQQQISPEIIRTVNPAGLVGDGGSWLVTGIFCHQKNQCQIPTTVLKADISGVHEVSVPTISELNDSETMACIHNGALAIESQGKTRHGNGINLEEGEDDDESDDKNVKRARTSLHHGSGRAQVEVEV
eukprot:Gb_06225 [translate_table: standard]